MAATTLSDKQKGLITDTTKYSNCKLEIYEEIEKMLTSENRFQAIDEREEKSVFDSELFKKVSKGKYIGISQ